MVNGKTVCSVFVVNFDVLAIIFVGLLFNGAIMCSSISVHKTLWLLGASTETSKPILDKNQHIILCTGPLKYYSSIISAIIDPLRRLRKLLSVSD